MAGVTTHVLDTERGRPAAGVRIDLYGSESGQWRLLKTTTTNADGRTDQPLVPAAEARVGEFMIEFHVEDYFGARPKLEAADPAFIDNVVVRFSVFDAKQHYHVPLLCTPGSASTYRGS